MHVTIRLFARLRDLAGTHELACDLPADATVAGAWRALVASHPALAPYGSSVSAAVNDDYAKLDARVHDGDDVAFLPPVSGG